MRTRKPCPGCGEVDRYRHADSVCSKCEKGLEEWREHVKRQRSLIERSRSRKLVALAGAEHWWPGFYYGGPRCHIEGLDETRKGLRKLFDDLAKLVCEPVPSNYSAGQDVGWLYHAEEVGDPESKRKPKYRPYLDYPCSRSISSSSEYALIDPELAKVLQQLWDHVARFTHMGYLGGVEDGRDLLMQLASGAMSTDKLAEEDVQRAKRIQVAGHLSRALRVKACKP